jgi:hypothetical protein
LHREFLDTLRLNVVNNITPHVNNYRANVSVSYSAGADTSWAGKPTGINLRRFSPVEMGRLKSDCSKTHFGVIQPHFLSLSAGSIP